MSRCGVLPLDDLAPELAGGTPCPFTLDGHTCHRTTTPDGRTYEWDAFTCAYPEDCTYEDDDGDCCVTYGEVAA